MVKIRFLSSTRPSPTSGGRICELHTLLSSFGRIRKDTDSGGPDPVNRTYHPSASPGRNAYTACGLDLDIEHTAAHGTDYGTTIGIGPSSHYRRHRPFIAWPCNEPGAPRRLIGYVFLDAALIAQGGVQVTFLSSCVGCPIYVADHSSLPPLCFSSFFLSCISRFR